MARFFRLRAMILALGIITVWSTATVAQTGAVPTSLQFIHLSPDPAASPIGVWAGVPFSGTVQYFPAAQSIAFRGATPAISGVAGPLGQISVSQFIGQSLNANLTAANATSAIPAIQGGQFSGLFLGTGANISLVRGVLDPTAYAQNPNGTPTRLTLVTVVDTARVAASTTRILFYHGVTDAPAIDVVIRETAGSLATRIPFDGIAPATVPTNNYTIDVYQSSPRTLLASYNAPLQTLGYGGQRVVIAANGFLNPANNRNGAALGLVAVPNTEGSVQSSVLTTAAPPPAEIRLPAVSLQTIHASADPSLSPIAFWLNTIPFGGAQFFPITTNLAFRTATPILTSLSAGSLQVPIQGNTGRPTDVLITAVTTGTLPGSGLARIQNYVLAPLANFTLLEGVLDPTRFVRNPGGRSIAFQTRTLPDSAISVPVNQTRVLFAHSATDMPDILLDVRDGGGNFLGTIGPLIYGSTFVATNLVTGNYTLAMRPNGTNSIFATFNLNLQSENLGGKRMLLTLTGFANPVLNQRGQGIGMLAVINDSVGRSFLLPSTFVSVRDNQQAQNMSAGMKLLPVSPNPVRESATVRYELSEAKEVALSVVDAQGAVVWNAEPRWMAVGTNTLTLETSSFAQGSYIVRLADALGNIASVRLVVVR